MDLGETDSHGPSLGRGDAQPLANTVIENYEIDLDASSGHRLSGSNCDRDVQVALRQSVGDDQSCTGPGFADVDLIVVPGGFSYGDYLRAGAMAALLRSSAKSSTGQTGCALASATASDSDECGLPPGVLRGMQA